MIDDVLDGVIACSNALSGHGRVRLQELHVVAAVGFGISITIEYDLFMRHDDDEDDRIR